MRPGRLFEAFLETASRRPEAPALTFGADDRRRRRTYVYRELVAAARELGSRLARRVDPERPVGILLQAQESQALHYLAALSQGLVPAILTPPNRKLNREYYLRTTEAVLDRCGFTAVVTDVEELHLGAPALRPFGLEPRGGGDARHAAADPALRSASFLQFSSGTTGIKRGVLVTDDAVLAQLEAYGDAIGLDERDVIVSWLPLYHDMGFIACLNMPLVRGVHVAMLDPVDWVTDPASFLRAVSDHGATLAWHPNFAFAFMARRVPDSALAGVRLSSLRGLVNCSEPVTFESQRQFARRFARYGLRQDVFWGCYAMAETTFALTHGTPADPLYLDPYGPDDATARRDGCFVSVGRPLPGVELDVVDDRGNVLGERRIGELVARSPFTFEGYFNDGDAGRAALAGGAYRTGDLGYRVGDAFYVVGRKKDVLIVSGVNVFPHDVEELVSATDGVVPGRVSVFSTFDPGLQTERVVVLFECSAFEPDQARATTLEVRKRVLAAFQIANFEAHALPPGWLVKSSSGKMARSANREKWQRRRPGAGSLVRA